MNMRTTNSKLKFNKFDTPTIYLQFQNYDKNDIFEITKYLIKWKKQREILF